MAVYRFTIYRFIALAICRFTMLVYLPVYHFSHKPSGLSYPTGSAYPGGMCYCSRRVIISSRNPDGV